MPSAPPRYNVGALLDKVFRNTTITFAFLVFAILFGIFIVLFISSLPALSHFGL